MAKTMVDASGSPYNYAVAAFDLPAEHRFELNFVKAALGPKNAYIAIYGVAKAYLNEHSSEVGLELEKATLPATSTLPRKEF